MAMTRGGRGRLLDADQPTPRGIFRRTWGFSLWWEATIEERCPIHDGRFLASDSVVTGMSEGQARAAVLERTPSVRDAAFSQEQVIAFLSAPRAYGVGCDRVDRIETHISVVFLANDRAFKLKRAVRFPYVDYSTLDRRRLFCDREVSLNRRTAPTLYRGVIPVTRSDEGSLVLGGGGVPVEWLVEMSRFEQSSLLDDVARRGALDVTLADAIGRVAADLHTIAAPRPDHGGAASLDWVVKDNYEELALAADVIDPQRNEQLRDASLEALRRRGHLVDARRADGWVRECHGDLHLGNICLLAGRPVLFDAIEFNDQLSCIDVLYDLAFLVMDLLHRNLPAHANTVLNAWLERVPHHGALSLLPLFLSCRAAIRGKVRVAAANITSDSGKADRLRLEARAYLDRAMQLISPGSGAIIAIGGLSGSGKSTLARRLAPHLGCAPGAIVLRSDTLRKHLFGIEPAERLLPVAYHPSVSRTVYGLLAREAGQVAAAGYVAIVDAVFGSEERRRLVRETAEHHGVPFSGVWLDAPLAVMERRLTARRGDASDATVDVLRQQRASVSPPSDWIHVDASADIDSVVAHAAVPLSRSATRPPRSHQE